jgi:hypothetical protein
VNNFTTICVVLTMLLVCAGSSSAALIFSDNFDAENGTIGVLDYTGFSQWTVTAGSVDLIGNGYHDYQPGPGLYLDMDGSQYAAGTIQSIALNLNPGQYVLSFHAAGNQRWLADIDSMDVSLGGLFTGVLALPGSAPWGSYVSPVITVGAPTVASISFAATGTDNVGLLLDNVELNSIDVIPAPGAILLGSIGAGLVGWLRRRRAL